MGAARARQTGHTCDRAARAQWYLGRARRPGKPGASVCPSSWFDSLLASFYYSGAALRILCGLVRMRVLLKRSCRMLLDCLCISIRVPFGCGMFLRPVLAAPACCNVFRSDL